MSHIPSPNDVVIVSAARTPTGRFQGGLSSLSATDLGGVAIAAALERAGIDPAQVYEVFMGNVLSAGVGQAPARQAALKGGLPGSVGAATINKVCGSGLKAVMLASNGIIAGEGRYLRCRRYGKHVARPLYHAQGAGRCAFWTYVHGRCNPDRWPLVQR